MEVINAWILEDLQIYLYLQVPKPSQSIYYYIYFYSEKLYFRIQEKYWAFFLYYMLIKLKWFFYFILVWLLFLIQLQKWTFISVYVQLISSHLIVNTDMQGINTTRKYIFCL